LVIVSRAISSSARAASKRGRQTNVPPISDIASSERTPMV
jgi:hypothetical protein